VITLAHYFWQKEGHAECTPEACDAGERMLACVNALLGHVASVSSWREANDPDTGSPISGTRGGAGDGGFRLSTSTTGSPRSAHKQARAVDVFDPDNKFDDYISRFDLQGGARNVLLERFGLYREAPHATPGWCHLQDIPPASRRRTFNP
jgi:hypothetical protein